MVNSEIRISDGTKSGVRGGQDLQRTRHRRRNDLPGRQRQGHGRRKYPLPFPAGRAQAMETYKSYALPIRHRPTVRWSSPEIPARSDAVAMLPPSGADLLVSEVTDSLDAYKEQQIKNGRWQLMTPEQQAGALRHMSEEHLLAEEVGKLATHARREEGHKGLGRICQPRAIPKRTTSVLPTSRRPARNSPAWSWSPTTSASSAIDPMEFLTNSWSFEATRPSYCGKNSSV